MPDINSLLEETNRILERLNSRIEAEKTRDWFKTPLSEDRIGRLEREMRDRFKELEHEQRRKKEFRDGAVFGFLMALVAAFVIAAIIATCRHS